MQTAQSSTAPRTPALLQENRTRSAKGLIIAAAFLSFLASVYLWFMVDREQGLFVGLWVPSILSFGALLLSGKGARS